MPLPEIGANGNLPPGWHDASVAGPRWMQRTLEQRREHILAKIEEAEQSTPTVQLRTATGPPAAPAVTVARLLEVDTAVDGMLDPGPSMAKAATSAPWSRQRACLWIWRPPPVTAAACCSTPSARALDGGS